MRLERSLQKFEVIRSNKCKDTEIAQLYKKFVEQKPETRMNNANNVS